MVHCVWSVVCEPECAVGFVLRAQEKAPALEKGMIQSVVFPVVSMTQGTAETIQ